jgi:carboxymethylenebutenolidase
MWNKIKTDDYEGMLAETISVPGHNGDRIRAYFPGPSDRARFRASC